MSEEDMDVSRSGEKAQVNRDEDLRALEKLGKNTVKTLETVIAGVVNPNKDNKLQKDVDTILQQLAGPGCQLVELSTLSQMSTDSIRALVDDAKVAHIYRDRVKKALSHFTMDAQQIATGVGPAVVLRTSREVRSLLDAANKHFAGEEPHFSELLKIYNQKPFKHMLAHLPNLTVFPKLFPDPTSLFLLHKLPLDIFTNLQKWDSKEVLGIQYGYYLAGPNGVGKSVSIYILACLARAHGWCVLYVPQCDTWASASTYEAAIDMLLVHLIPCLQPIFNEVLEFPKMNCTTWGELLSLGLTEIQLKAIVLSTIMDLLCTQKKFPVLFIFDEVNALFSMKLSWTNDFAKNGPFFSSLAATLNRMNITRGWKIISGTGHEKFLAELPNGFDDLVLHLTPFVLSEFMALIESDLSHPWITTVLQKMKQASIKDIFCKRLAYVMGRVPRQLRGFSQFITNTVGVSYDNVVSYFTKEQPKLVQPTAQLQFLLNRFAAKTRVDFERLHSRYYHELSADEKLPFLNMCLDALTFSPYVVASHRYLDLNLIYKNPETSRYSPLTPTAGQAIVGHMRATDNAGNLFHDDRIKIISAISKDEAGRPFERCFLKSLLLHTPEFKLSKLDGTDITSYVVDCREIINLPDPKADITKQARLCYSGLLDAGTMLVPENPCYPTADYVYIGDHFVLIFQLTVGRASQKVPKVASSDGKVKSNSYTAIHNSEKWEDICMIYPKDADYATHPHPNFSECVLNTVLGIDDSKVVLDEKAGELVVKQPVGWQVVYVIVAPEDFIAKNGTGPAKDCPWARLLTNKSLEQLLGTVLFSTLAAKANV